MPARGACLLKEGPRHSEVFPLGLMHLAPSTQTQASSLCGSPCCPIEQGLHALEHPLGIIDLIAHSLPILQGIIAH